MPTGSVDKRWQLPRNHRQRGSARGAAHRLGSILNMTHSLAITVGVAANGAVLAVLLVARLDTPIDRASDSRVMALQPAPNQTLPVLRAGQPVLRVGP